jgi:hypothetical protein
MLSSLSTKTLVQNKVAQADPQGKLARKKKRERNEVGLGKDTEGPTQLCWK